MSPPAPLPTLPLMLRSSILPMPSRLTGPLQQLSIPTISRCLSRSPTTPLQSGVRGHSPTFARRIGRVFGGIPRICFLAFLLPNCVRWERKYGAESCRSLPPGTFLLASTGYSLRVSTLLPPLSFGKVMIAGARIRTTKNSLASTFKFWRLSLLPPDKSGSRRLSKLIGGRTQLATGAY